MKLKFPVACALFLVAGNAFGTSFVVPTDRELVAKAEAIVVGTVEESFVQERGGTIETVYEIRLDRTLKRSAFTTVGLVRVVSPGGVIGDRGVIVPGAAHYGQGERVLVFLDRENDRWTTLDMTLGRFRFATSTTGDRMLVRETDDVEAWDRNGNVYREKVRREDGFLRFIEETVKGRAVVPDYEVDPSEVTLPPRDEVRNRFAIGANATNYPPATYTSWVGGKPVRWPNMSSGVTWRKVASQNIPGASDGGVSAIQSGLAAWNNECGSLINLIYGGTTTTPSTNFDSVRVVEYNDPQNRISGSWTGSGTVAVTFTSFSGSHTFNGVSYNSISDADVVFQNGYTATQGAFAPAMTHELGHGIGWRHSNQNHQTGGACNSAVEECTSAAIMNSSVSGSFGFNLQPWDINAAQSIYPGGTCGGGGGGNVRGDFNGDGLVDVLLRNTSNGQNVVWFMNNMSQIGSGYLSTLADQNWKLVGAADFNADNRTDILWRNTATGQNVVWFMNGVAQTGSAALPSMTGSNWSLEGVGDFTGDGRFDLLWHNHVTGNATVWIMNGTTMTGYAELGTVNLNWHPTLAADFNGDGHTDILWRNSSTGENVFWRMNRTTQVSGIYISSLATAWKASAVGDYNADGKPDIFWHNTSTGQTAVWFIDNFGNTAGGRTLASVNTAWIVVGPR
ncbi:MAG TPA: FG-GAP-like repeat-containing protein [Thermoanaerobaculia bacterium]|jgi:hypothetical protein|nr:FG-GAP-like repeat-containing protein [Thermoanaerobaculia bacterium]